MSHFIISFFSGFPPELSTVLMAMTPFGELRLSLPVALLAYKLPFATAFYLSVIGNMIPPTFILLFAGKFDKWVENNSGWFFGKAWVKYLARVREKFSGKYARYGLLALVLFVGIPLPMTGAWSGSVAAFIFGLPPKKAWPYIFVGVVMSGVITSMVALGVGRLF
ncbi:MAG: small multi-drug export protein [Parcubacteria group bacterium]|nr:small multi-drug export protein [Parcubacteria group bacterium]